MKTFIEPKVAEFLFSGRFCDGKCMVYASSDRFRAEIASNSGFLGG